ncbi:MAG TPA: tetratricopeptide repeat protein, partial [Xanthomonadales bacterium]
MSFFNELNRRNVFKVGIAYVVVAWLVAQVLQLIFESFGTPDWVMKTVLVLMASGLLFALFFSWAFEMTPEGLKREYEVDRSQSITPQTGKKLNTLIFVVMALAVAYFAYDKFVLSADRESAAIESALQEATSASLVEPVALQDEEAAVDRSIAVLPFVNMSSDEEQEYFSDGLSEELLNLLAKIPELRVTSRSSAFAFKGEKIDIPEVARKLNVAHILEGSVRKAGNQVRVTAQLIDARSDIHLWSETYDRTLDDIFAIQDEIASTVVEQLKVTLLGAAPHVQETNPEAYALYLQARHLSRVGTNEADEQAIELYKQALSIDPDYAGAWVGLSVVYANQVSAGVVPADKGYSLSREVIQKALAIDPQSALAQVGLGNIAINYENNLGQAALYYERALALDPGNFLILNHASTMLQSLGRIDQAVAIKEYASALDPVNPSNFWNLGQSYIFAGRYADAIRALETSLRLSPGNTGA